MNTEKLRKFLKSLENDELIEIYKVLATSKDLIVNEIKEELMERNLKEHKVCSVCGTPLSDNYFELLFDRIGFRKRAYFCGKDCLIYFLNSFDKKANNLEGNNKNEKFENSIVQSKSENITKAQKHTNQQCITKRKHKSTNTLNLIAERIFSLFF